MVITCVFNLNTCQYNIINAFTNATPKQLIACACAEGFERSGTFLLAQKAIYRLKISSLDWFKELSHTLDDLGLHSVPDTNCFFINDWLILFFFIDDIIALFAGKDSQKMNKFESSLMARYEIQQLEEAEYFLEIQII
jgi:hypothetical protein